MPKICMRGMREKQASITTAFFCYINFYAPTNLKLFEKKKKKLEAIFPAAKTNPLLVSLGKRAKLNFDPEQNTI